MTTVAATNDIAIDESPRNKKKQKFFIIDGLIGAGKTSLIKAVAIRLRAKGYKVQTILEPVHRWQEIGILDKFYEDQCRWAYSFQTLTFTTRIKECIKGFEECPDADVYLIERSILTDKHIFMELQKDSVDPMEMVMYNECFDLYLRLMPLVLKDATYLYLNPNIPTCMDRVSKRNRPEEVKKIEGKDEKPSGVSLEYQKRLHDAHEVLFKGSRIEGITHLEKRPFPLDNVIEIKDECANSNFIENTEESRVLIDKIVGKLRL